MGRDPRGPSAIQEDVCRANRWTFDGTLDSRCLVVYFPPRRNGSRAGRLVLVEDRQTSGNHSYTVKRFRNDNEKSDEGEWRHTRIHLESLNPEYPSWDLDPSDDKYRIIAEFVRVIE